MTHHPVFSLLIEWPLTNHQYVNPCGTRFDLLLTDTRGCVVLCCVVLTVGCVANTRLNSIQLLILDPDYRGGGEQLLADLGSPAHDDDSGGDDNAAGAGAAGGGGGGAPKPSATAWRRITRSVNQLNATAFQIRKSFVPSRSLPPSQSVLT